VLDEDPAGIGAAAASKASASSKAEPVREEALRRGSGTTRKMKSQPAPSGGSRYDSLLASLEEEDPSS